jgi:hypothetical protein
MTKTEPPRSRAQIQRTEALARARERAKESLTFGELRLANLLQARRAAQDMDRIAEILADAVIQIDRMAILNGIDLADAIRARFEPEVLEQSDEPRDKLGEHDE